MLQRRPDPTAVDSTPATPTARAATPRRAAPRRARRAAVLGLAVATVVPGLTAALSRGQSRAPAAPAVPVAPGYPQLALAQQSPDTSGMSDAQMLDAGSRLYRQNDYDQSMQVLQQVDPDRLSPQGRQSLNQTLTDAERGAGRRREARASFQQGQDAWMAGEWVEAIAAYRAAALNDYADPATRAKAQEQIPLAQAKLESEGTQPRDLYDTAVAEYDQGDLAPARTKFAALDAVRFNAPLFKKSPANYLRDIDRANPQLAQAPAPAADDAAVGAGTMNNGAMTAAPMASDTPVAVAQATPRPA